MTIEEKKALNAARVRAVNQAWKHEAELVKDGKGTRQWTIEEQKEMLSNPNHKVAGYHGHHMKSVNGHEEYAGDPKNIQFLSREEHMEAHQGWTQNQTNGYYNYESHTMELFNGEELREVPVQELNETFSLSAEQENSYTVEYGNDNSNTVDISNCLDDY